jgi:hypothetical protein
LISLKGDPGCIWAQCILIAAAIVAAVLSFFVTEDLRRLNEARQNNQREALCERPFDDQDKLQQF